MPDTWKGPWKCGKCGTYNIAEQDAPHYGAVVSETREDGGRTYRRVLCDGKLIPYERRAHPAEAWVSVKDVKALIVEYIDKARDDGETDARGIRDGLCYEIDRRFPLGRGKE